MPRILLKILYVLPTLNKEKQNSTVFQRPGSAAWFWVWRQTLPFQQAVCFTMHVFPLWTICTHGSSFQTGRGAQPTVWSLMTANAHWSSSVCWVPRDTHATAVPSSKGSLRSVEQAGQTCCDLNTWGQLLVAAPHRTSKSWTGSPLWFWEHWRQKYSSCFLLWLKIRLNRDLGKLKHKWLQGGKRTQVASSSEAQVFLCHYSSCVTGTWDKWLNFLVFQFPPSK